jgi:hypothetical protein
MAPCQDIYRLVARHAGMAGSCYRAACNMPASRPSGQLLNGLQLQILLTCGLLDYVSLWDDIVLTIYFPMLYFS